MKKILFDYIKQHTRNMKSFEDDSLCASAIAKELGCSRNVVSQYLNEMVNQGKLIKTNTRPVYFYDCEELQNKYQLLFEQKIFASIDELEKYCSKEKTEDFEKLIGYQDSLRHVVEQCKAAISYPPNGLPILINGPTGTGKSYLAQLMYEYAVNNDIIDENAQFITVNCSEYANNPELLTANLFGSKKGAYTGADTDNVGLLQVADGGVLFLDEVHCLRAECQEKLFLFMDKGIYHRLGDNETWYHAKTHLIFATTENPETALLKTLLRRIPLIVQVPSLDDRSLNEKKMLIVHVLKEEQKKIKKKIYISNLVYQALMNASYVGNVGSVKNLIKAACANAFLNDEDHNETLKIHIYNLPDEILQQTPIISTKIVDQQEAHMMELVQLDEGIIVNDPLIQLYEKLIETYRKLKNQEIEYNSFYDKVVQHLSYHNDQIMFEMKNINNPSLDFTRKIVDKIFSIVINRYGIKISNNNIVSYAKYLNEYTKSSSIISNWIVAHHEEVKEMLTYVSSHLPREYYIAKEIIENLRLNLDIELDDMAKLTLVMNIKSFNRDMTNNNTICVILCHGYSTASSIADAANKMLGQYIFDAIDMQLDVSAERILEQLNNFLKLKDRFEELILLVDMGSLEEIYKGIHHMLDCNIAIINNVNTKLALEVGNGIIQKKDVQSIFEKVLNRSVYEYQYIDNRKKTDVILSVCATGLGSAKKITELLLSSLPNDIPIEVVPYDFTSLHDRGIHDPIFKRYQVQTIIGTMNPGIEGVPYVAVEEIVLNSNIEVLYQVFSRYLSPEGIQMLSANMLKNFTLSNIVNHLTILNAEKVLEDVEVVVMELEKHLNRQFSATVKVGLYMHLSCLIERLMMRNQVGTTEDIVAFENDHQDFIRVAKESFSVVRERYSVEIPVAEIAYIYNYIQID